MAKSPTPPSSDDAAANQSQEPLDLTSTPPQPEESSRMAIEPGVEIDLEDEEGFEEGGFPWLLVGGAIALAVVMGGALWWQQSQAAGDQAPLAAGAGKPAVGVSVVPVRSATVADASQFVGTLRAANRVTFQAETEGRIVRILVRPGRTIRVNQPLFQIEPGAQRAALGSAQANIASAQASVQAVQSSAQQAQVAVAAAESEEKALLRDRQAKVAEAKLAEQELKRIQGLVDEGVLAAQLLDQAVGGRDRIVAEMRAIEERIQGSRREREGAQLRASEAVARLRQAEAELGRSRAEAALEGTRLQETQVRSSLDGVIGDIEVKVGDFVQKNDVLAVGFQNQLLELRINVPVEKAAQLRLGTPVQISDSNQQVLGVGRVNFVSPTTDGDTQTVLIKVGVPNQKGTLRDGQFVSARVLLAQRQNQAVIPVAAIARQGKEQFVYVVQRDGEKLTAKKIVVQVGKQQGDLVEIVAGLTPGMSVVSAGLQRLQDGAPIQLLEPPTPAPGIAPNLTPLPKPSQSPASS